MPTVASTFEPDPAFKRRVRWTVDIPNTPSSAPHRADLGLVLPFVGPKCNGHLYHAVECLATLFAWASELFRGRTVDAIVVAEDLFDARTHGFFLPAVFPGATLVRQGSAVFREALVVDVPAMTPETWTPSEINQGHAAISSRSHAVSARWFPAFRDRILAAAGASHGPPPERPRDVRALYLMRAGSARELDDGLLAGLAWRLEAVHGVAMEVVVLDKMALADQVSLFARADIVIGVHGNGFTNIAWMPPHGAVIELFPKQFHHYYYQILAEWAGLHYCGLQEGNPHPYRVGTRRDDAYGPLAFAPWSIDWDLFDAEMSWILDRMLIRVPVGALGWPPY